MSEDGVATLDRIEDSAARLRFFVNASHTPQQLETTVVALAAEVACLDRPPRA